MSATVLPMRPKQALPDETWLTREAIQAYYVALSVQPELVHAPAVVRDTVVKAVLAGMHAFNRQEDERDAKALDQCIALMRQDHAAQQARTAGGGW